MSRNNRNGDKGNGTEQETRARCREHQLRHRRKEGRVSENLGEACGLSTLALSRGGGVRECVCDVRVRLRVLGYY